MIDGALGFRAFLEFSRKRVIGEALSCNQRGREREECGSRKAYSPSSSFAAALRADSRTRGPGPRHRTPATQLPARRPGRSGRLLPRGSAAARTEPSEGECRETDLGSTRLSSTALSWRLRSGGILWAAKRVGSKASSSSSSRRPTAGKRSSKVSSSREAARDRLGWPCLDGRFGRQRARLEVTRRRLATHGNSSSPLVS